MKSVLPALALAILCGPAAAETFTTAVQRVPGRVIDGFVARDERGLDTVLAISIERHGSEERRWVTALAAAAEAGGEPVAVPPSVVAVDAAELGLAPGPEVAWLSANEVHVLSARGESLLRLPLEPPLPLPPRTWELAQVPLVRDWDGDGRLELLAPSTEGARVVGLAPGDATQTLALPRIADYGTPTLENYWRPGLLVSLVSWPMFDLADDDGDGRPDLFAIDRYSLRVFRASEGGLPRTASRVRALPPFTPEEERRHLATTLLGYARDLDGDGRAEVVLHRMVGELAKSRSSTTLHANAGGGADPLAAPFARLDRSGGNAALRLDDLDGDGRVEMLEAWVGFGVVQAVRMLTLRSAETTLRVLALPSAPGAEPLELWSADVTFPFDFATSRVTGILPFTEADWNGDGRLDLCWGDGSGLLRFRLGEAGERGPRFGPIAAEVPLAVSGDLLAADVDADGLVDFVAWDPLDLEGRLYVGRNRGVLPGSKPALRARPEP